nr:hypothetical protein [Tanacetum cinerariifolium]
NGGRPPRFKLVKRKIPGNARRSRLAIKVIRRRQRDSSSRSVSSPSPPVEPEIKQPVLSPGPLRDVFEAFGEDVYNLIQKDIKEGSSTGNPLPSSVRDLFPDLSDLTTAIQIANSLRSQYGLPKLIMSRKNRIEMVRTIARTRESIYIEVLSALLLPQAPLAPIGG